MGLRGLAAVVVLLCAGGVGCQSSANDNPAIGGGGVGQTAEVTLNGVNGGPAGTVELAESPTLVFTLDLTISPAGAAPEPAGVHTGTCNSFDPVTAFALVPVTGGKSSSTLQNTTLSELESTPHVIVVQRSASDQAAISCGQIPPASAASP